MFKSKHMNPQMSIQIKACDESQGWHQQFTDFSVYTHPSIFKLSPAKGILVIYELNTTDLGYLLYNVSHKITNSLILVKQKLTFSGGKKTEETI